MPEQETLGDDSAHQECAGVSDEELRERLHSAGIDPEKALPLLLCANEDLFRCVAQEFNNAEVLMKDVEWIVGTDIPSINELRYVGYHVFRACQFNDDYEKQREELRRALRHCHRASYDAVELGIIAELEFIGNFVDEFRDVPIIDTVPDYLELRKEVERIRVYLKDAAPVEERGDYYKIAAVEMDKLKAINKKLNAATEELKKVRTNFQRQEGRARWNTLITSAGWVVAVLTLLCTFYFNCTESKVGSLKAADQGAVEEASPKK